MKSAFSSAVKCFRVLLLDIAYSSIFTSGVARFLTWRFSSSRLYFKDGAL